MIFGVGLQVFGQMLDHARGKCTLLILAARIFFMQLELRDAQRFRALRHKRSAYCRRRRRFRKSRCCELRTAAANGLAESSFRGRLWMRSTRECNVLELGTTFPSARR